MKARQIMSSPVISAGAQSTLEDIARLMLRHRIGGVPILDARGQLQGMVTESDFVAKKKCVPFSMFQAPQLFGEWLGPEQLDRLHEDARRLTAADVMSSPVLAVGEDEDLHAILLKMLDGDINRVPVLRDGVPVGIVARRDVLRAIVDQPAAST